MKVAIATLQGVSPYSQGRYHQTEKHPKELADAYERRTWREKMHYNQSGQVIIPPMQFANSLKEAAKYLSLPVPGKGKSTFTKNFEAGVMVVDQIELGINKDDVEPEGVHVPSDGRRGGTSRVMKYFPFIPAGWKAKVSYYIMDDMITQDVFMKVLETSGQLIGIGRFRPRNWGYYGRFEIKKLEWIEK